MQLATINLDEDYATFCGWWTRHGVAVVPRNVLPDFGAKVEQDGEVYACGWMYRDVGGQIAMVSWITTNPKHSHAKESVESVKMLLDFFETQATPGVVMSYVPAGKGLSRQMKEREWLQIAQTPHVLMGKKMEPSHGS